MHWKFLLSILVRKLTILLRFIQQIYLQRKSYLTSWIIDWDWTSTQTLYASLCLSMSLTVAWQTCSTWMNENGKLIAALRMHLNWNLLIIKKLWNWTSIVCLIKDKNWIFPSPDGVHFQLQWNPNISNMMMNFFSHAIRFNLSDFHMKKVFPVFKFQIRKVISIFFESIFYLFFSGIRIGLKKKLIPWIGFNLRGKWFQLKKYQLLQYRNQNQSFNMKTGLENRKTLNVCKKFKLINVRLIFSPHFCRD